MNSKKLLWFATLFFFFVSWSALAQQNSHWNKIGQLTFNLNGSVFPFEPTCGYFWNAQHGLVGVVSRLQPPTIFYTTDGGRVWKMSITPSNNSSVDAISCIYMKDSDTGWASLYLAGGEQGQSVLWKTIDGGITWQSLPKYGEFGTTVWSGIADISLNPSNDSLLLPSIGTQWTFPYTDAFSCAWLSHKIGMIDTWTLFGGSYKVTLNGGVSWSAAASPVHESFGICGVSQWKAFIIASEVDPISYNTYISTNYGQTWNSSLATSSPGWVGWTGDVESGPAVAYAQTHGGAGLFRTTDIGKTWENIGGPGNGPDTRFCVTGCDGGVVVAFDDSGGVWETTDGGDGTLGRSEPQFSANTLSLSAKLCAQNEGTIKLEGIQCNPFVLDSIAFVDSSLVRLGVLSLDSSPVIPETFDSGHSDLIKVRWNPSAGFNQDTTVTTHLFLRYLDGATGVERDTLLSLTLVAQAPPIALSVAPNLNFPSVSTCAFADSTMILTNHGCGPDTIVSLVLTGAGFSGASDSLPIIVLPGDSVTFEYHFVPPASGVFSGTVKLHVTSMGLTEDPEISLTGRGVQGMGVLDVRSTSLQAGSFSFCDGDTALTDTLRNTGCDTLVISNLHFSHDGAWSSASSLRPDSLLLPGDSAILQFYFAPRVKGAHSATLSFHSQNIVNDPGFDTTVTIFGMGLPGKTALFADTTPRDFGALFECESRDTTIWLRNPGCDTLTIDSVEFTSAAYSPDTVFPISIAGNDSVAVRVHYTSTASTTNGAVTFYSNANSGPGTGTVPLRATAIPPAQLQLSLSSAQSATDGQVVTFYLILSGDTGAAAKKLAGMNFTLSDNNDLLSYQGASGVAIRRGNPLRGIETDTLDWSAGSSASDHTGPDTIGSLSFQVYLTDSSATPLALSNISLSTPGFEPDCIASIDSNASGFSYLYQCGDRLIQEAMLGVPFTIEGIVPNPAQTSFEVNVSNPGSASIAYTLFDALGNEVFSAMGVGRAQHVPTDGLPSGTYFLRLSENGYVQSRQISIEH